MLSLSIEVTTLKTLKLAPLGTKDNGTRKPIHNVVSEEGHSQISIPLIQSWLPKLFMTSCKPQFFKKPLENAIKECIRLPFVRSPRTQLALQCTATTVKNLKLLRQRIKLSTALHVNSTCAKHAQWSCSTKNRKPWWLKSNGLTKDASSEVLLQATPENSSGVATLRVTDNSMAHRRGPRFHGILRRVLSHLLSKRKKSDQLGHYYIN